MEAIGYRRISYVRKIPPDVRMNRCLPKPTRKETKNCTDIIMMPVLELEQNSVHSVLKVEFFSFVLIRDACKVMKTDTNEGLTYSTVD